MKPRVLLVGCGSIGKRHLRNLKALGLDDLHAFDPRPDRAQEAADQTGAKPCTRIEEGLARKPDLALICTPNSLHVAAALSAARAGCHLFIEKPLSHSLDGISELQEEVRRRGLTALVGCNMRFHPGIAMTRRLLSAGVVGRIACARVMAGSYLPEWHPWEDYRQGYSARADLGGGVILDGIHEIDYLLDILGPAAEVSCVAGRFSDIDIQTEDAAEITLRLRHGALANIHLDYLQRAYRRTAQFSGTEGTLEWDFDRPEVRVYRAASKSWDAHPLPAADVNAMYVAEMEHLLACLAGREKPAQDLAAALAALEVALAAKRSAETGTSVALNQVAA